METLKKRKEISMETKERLLLGFVYGDCLGVPYEFKRRGTFKCDGTLTSGSHNQPKGTWSDDTSMTLALLDYFKTYHETKVKRSKYNDDIDYVKIMELFTDFVRKGKYTVDGIAFDYGVTVLNAVNDFANGEMFTNTDIYSNGNGALMRCLPLVFEDLTEAQMLRLNGLTHNHEISHACCLYYVILMKRLLKTKNKECYIEVYNDMLKYSYFGKVLHKYCYDIEHIKTLKESDIKSSGYVVDTLISALWCFINNDNYLDCVCASINLGEDTDTIGAICGSLSATVYDLPKLNIRNSDVLYKYIYNIK